MLQWIRGSGKDGANPSAPGKTSAKGGEDAWLAGNSERYFGLENFGNTCYCNSVLQALYFARPFRDCLLAYSYPLSAAVSAANALGFTLPPLDSPLIISSHGIATGSAALPLKAQLEAVAQERADDTLLTTLNDLFTKISTQKKRTGVMRPQTFVTKLKEENELFQGITQQDAQEFLNYTLNAIAEILVRHKKEYIEKLQLLMPSLIPPQPQATQIVPESKAADRKPYASTTWVHELFEGLYTNETKCLTCENTTNRDEPFLDLSIDISQHSSVSACLRNFSTSETLCAKDKFYCDTCKSLQEAEKRMKIKSLPNILAVHLKRFKYQENLQRFIKLNYRVVFPFELKLFNTTDDAADPDRLYTLSSVIVHLGIGPHQGHYISLVKSHDHWICFDDDSVQCVDESELTRYFGDLNNPGTGYILLYERVGFDAAHIVRGMRPSGVPLDVVPPPLGEDAEEEAVSPGKAFSQEARSSSAPVVASLMGHVGSTPSVNQPVPQSSVSSGNAFSGFGRFKRPSMAADKHNSLQEGSAAPEMMRRSADGEAERATAGTPSSSVTAMPETGPYAWWKRKN
ncbi:hypothetical protein BC830DRAFT_1190528 [Chytriomyces sp. MP71]|nr:hypothetical protein BC830DRAFT_1190528 [Chytriomyces sp. MP71]